MMENYTPGDKLLKLQLQRTSSLEIEHNLQIGQEDQNILMDDNYY